MTLFANPFNQIPNMQAQEDAMEVNADLKGNMAMEEDNIDIDFEIGDAHQDEEDSMMDDDDAPGAQAQPDGDQQMDDDLQEPKDQDEVITDYAGDQAPTMEVPMTEDIPQPVAEPAPVQPGSIFSGQISNAVPDPPVDSSPAAFLSAPAAPVESSQLASTQDVDIENRHVPSDSTPTDHLESIRSLYETPSNVEGPTQERPSMEQPLPSESLENDDLKPDQQVEPQLANPTNITANDPTETKVPVEQPQEDPAVQEQEQEPVANTDPEPTAPEDLATEPETLQSVAANEQAEVETLPREPDVPATLDDHSEESQQAAEDAIVEPVNILVTCQNVQMSLFPPLQEHGTPETYLLPDNQHSGSPIRSLLSACSKILFDSIDEHEELEMLIPSLGLTFRHSFNEAEHYSVRDMSDLHFQLHQNDGIEQPEPLHVILQVRRCLSSFIDQLYTLVAEGKGMHAFAELKHEFDGHMDSSKDDNPEQDSHAVTDSKNTVPQDGQEEDEFGEPDLPESEFEFDGVEEPEENALTEPAKSLLPQPEQTTQTEDRPVLEIQETGDSAADEEPYDAEGDDLERPSQEEENTELHVFVDEEVDEEADDYYEDGDQDVAEEHLETTADTNHESLEADDAQRHNLNPIVEPSQSLHSATQPDEDGTHAGTSAGSENEALVEGNTNDTTEEQDNEHHNSGTSSSTIQDAGDADVQDKPLRDDNNSAGNGGEDDDDDFFDEDYEAENNNDHEGEGDELDFGLEEQPHETPQSLKRSRTAADEFGEDADADEGHQLKRTRSG